MTWKPDEIRRPTVLDILLALLLVAAIVAAVFGLAGCSAGSSSSASARPSSAAPASSSAPPTAVAIGQRLGCTDIYPAAPGHYAYDNANATCQGAHVIIATFRSNALRDAWVTVNDQGLGGTRTGDRYAVVVIVPASF